jgi:kexin
MKNDDQVVLPEPPHHKVAPNLTTQTFTSAGKTWTETSTIIADHSKTTKKLNKPTAHLPDDHAEMTGESDHPLDGLPTATPTPVPTSAPASGADEEEDIGDELEYLGPWSSLRDSQNWFYIAAGSVIIFLGAAGAYFLYRRQQQKALGRGAASGWLGGGYSTLSGRDEDSLPMSALERGRLLFGGRPTASQQTQYQPGRTRQLYDAFALSDSDDEEAAAAFERADAEEGRRLTRRSEDGALADRKVDDSYMSSFLADEEELRSPAAGGGPRHSTPSPEPGRRSDTVGRYRDDDDDST